MADRMPPPPPQTAATAIVAFAVELFSAITLRRAVFDAAAARAQTWRKAAVVVILAAIAADSIGFYTDLDELLVRILVNWSLLPIMMIALLRWAFGCSIAHRLSRIFGEEINFGALVRCAGYGYAPALFQLAPALFYLTDLAPVTFALVSTFRWLSLVWLLAALTLAMRAAGASTTPRAFAIGLVVFIASNLFDVMIDAILYVGIGGTGPPSALPVGMALLR